MSEMVALAPHDQVMLNKFYDHYDIMVKMIKIVNFKDDDDNIAGGGGASTPSRSHTRWSRSAEGPGALPGKLVLCFSTV